MGLADLKKNPTSTRLNSAHNIDLEGFIEGANLYAMGKSENNTPCKLKMQTLAQEQVEAGTSKRSKRCRHATFTLTELAIAQLAELAQENKMAKSKLIRQFILQHYSTTHGDPKV